MGGNLTFDISKAVERSRNAADTLAGGVEFLLKKNDVQVISGHGRLKSASTVEVADAEGRTTDVEAKSIVIASGSRNKSIPVIPVDGERIITSTEAMLLEKPPESMTIIGGGAIGTGAALALRAQGAANVTLIEPGELRRARLAGLKGVTVIASAADRPDLTGACHLVIDGVGFEATRATACAAARPGGQIVHIGLGADRGGLDIRRMTLQEIGFTGTYTYTEQDFRDTAEAIFSGALGPLDWFDRRPLSDGPQAFADIRAGRAAAPKILLIPDQEDRTA